jgi:hypothetical protein
VDTIQYWDIDWGDGETTHVDGSSLGGVQHTYMDEGAFTVTATCVDEDGTFSEDLNVDAKYRYNIELDATTKSEGDSGTFEGTIKENGQGVENVEVTIKVSKAEADAAGIELNDSSVEGSYYVRKVSSATLGGFKFSLHGDNLTSRKHVTVIFEVTGAKTKSDTYALHDRL